MIDLMQLNEWAVAALSKCASLRDGQDLPLLLCCYLHISYL